MSRSPGLLATAVLLSPLPYDEPDRLVRLWAEFTFGINPQVPESVPGFNEYRTRELFQFQESRSR